MQLCIWAIIGTFPYVMLEPMCETRKCINPSDFQPNRNMQADIVDTINKCQNYMLQFGYLSHCGTQVEISARQSNVSKITSSITIQLQENYERDTNNDKEKKNMSKVCSSEKVREALRTYQKKVGVYPSGVCDSATMTHMNRPRCGNTDSAVEFNQLQLEKEFSTLLKNTSSVLHERRRRETLTMMKALLPHWLGEMESSIVGHFRRRRSVYRAIENAEDLSVLSAEERKNRKEHRMKKRKKRTTLQNHVLRYPPSQKIIRWCLRKDYVSQSMPIDRQVFILAQATRMWSEVCPLDFRLVHNCTHDEEDLEIAFIKGTTHPQLGCTPKYQFDGKGRVIAHSLPTKFIHFDDAENYCDSAQGACYDANNIPSVNLLRAALHEVGHALGIPHLFGNPSIMHPESGNSVTMIELLHKDREIVKQIYGPCTVNLLVVFDWVRRIPSGIIFNTYLVSDVEQYWMYDNHAKHPRYGDPSLMSKGWRGVPSRPDAFLQLPNWKRNVFKTFFFKDSNVYEFDNDKNRVNKPPINIKKIFGSKSRGLSSIFLPVKIDSAFFDQIRKRIYFFRNDKVYIYKYDAGISHELNVNKCCERVADFATEFPTKKGTQLTGFIDSVYYSYANQTLYFFQNDRVWVDECFVMWSKSAAFHCLSEIGNWNNYWLDVCTVIDTN